MRLKGYKDVDNQIIDVYVVGIHFIYVSVSEGSIYIRKKRELAISVVEKKTSIS
ncbi:hypothetical protein FORC47_2163 [Bacillus cereus]|nr:hypothetical protein FORC47_2163 [Bacillus cereus]